MFVQVRCATVTRRLPASYDAVTIEESQGQAARDALVCNDGIICWGDEKNGGSMQEHARWAHRDMSLATARLMNEVNARFYRDNAASFSQTRRAGWPGWHRCLEEARPAAGQPVAAPGASRAAAASPATRVLDLACGNLRFARFLADACDAPVAYVGVDNCPELGAGAATGDLPPAWSLQVAQLDVVGALLAGTLASSLDATLARAWGTAGSGPQANLAVAFGFLHHVPTFSARLSLLRALLADTAPGGTCCVSFWRFMSNERLAAKAHVTTTRGLNELGLAPDALGEHDYLLGWQDVPGAYRYCHHFCSREVDALLSGLGSLAQPVARFNADGRSGDLNAYVVLRRR